MQNNNKQNFRNKTFYMNFYKFKKKNSIYVIFKNNHINRMQVVSCSGDMRSSEDFL